MNNSSDIKSTLSRYGLAIAFTTMMACLASPSWAGGKQNPRTCSRIASITFKACSNDITDDFWINIGNCLNTEDRKEEAECKREANTALREERELCRDQKHARYDICDVIGQQPYAPEIDPANFLTPEQAAANPNPYFLLTPGLVRVLKSGDETITVTVTDETIEILGVKCTVVRDTVVEDGKLVEDTDDWYAQDSEGNVWYFGEISKNYEDGQLTDLDGSWKSGVDKAQPGIIMQAEPVVGDVYRQEYALGEAEDMAEVAETNHTTEFVDVADCSAGCLVTREFLPIEPEVEEFKYYAPGIGLILAIDGNTGDREELIEVTNP